MTLNFEGFIKDVQYTAFLVEAEDLQKYDHKSFDINKAETYGKIIFPDGEFAYSKWVSPKRTRSYPFERLLTHYDKKPFTIPWWQVACNSADEIPLAKRI